VLEQVLKCFPEADLFSLVDFLKPEQRGFILNKTVCTSFLQKMPFSRRSFRKYFPLMPLAVEQFDLSRYKLVISSSHSVAKGVITGPDQLHVCYCHSPMRYAWELQHQYLVEARLDHGLIGWATKAMLHRARLWDLRTANGVDEFIANSQFIARRIWKVYRRGARVIYPPVDVEAFSLKEQKEDFYLTVSRLVPYKRVNLIVEAFKRMPGKRLVVIGDGPQLDAIRASAPVNVDILGFQEFETVVQYMQRARCFVFAAEEDFGICVAEAQSCGTPVIAFGRGGTREIIREEPSKHPTGLFFRAQTAEAIVDSVNAFEENRGRFLPEHCRNNATRFSVERFRKEFADFCDEALTRTRREAGVREFTALPVERS